MLSRVYTCVRERECARDGDGGMVRCFVPRPSQGYQISQYDVPICAGGVVEAEVDGVKK